MIPTSADLRRCVVCAALSAALYAAMQYAMGLGFASVIITPIPVAFMAALSPLWLVLVSTGVGSGVLASVLGATSGLEYFVQFGLGGVVLGVGIRDGKRPEWSVGFFSLSGLLAFAGLLALTAIPQSMGPMEALKSLAGEWITPLREAMSAEKLDPKQLIEVEEYIRTLEWSFTNVPFGIVAGFGVLAGWFNALTLRRLLSARGMIQPSWTSWSAPDWFVWIPILAGFAGLFAKGEVRIVAMNVMIPAVVVYFLQGVAIVESLFDSWRLSGLVRFFLMALVFLQLQIFGVALSAAGAFDQWIDLRRRFAPKKVGPDE